MARTFIGRRQRTWDIAAKGKAVEAVIDSEVIPPGAFLTYQSFNLILQGKAEMDWYQFMEMMLTVWWLPAYDDEQNQTANTFSALKTLADRRIPKTYAQSVTSGKFDAGDTGKDELYSDTVLDMGDADTNLIWRPDQISLRTLLDHAMPALLYSKLIRLGWGVGAAFRSGTAKKVVYANSFKAGIQNGIRTSLPGYVVYLLTIPNVTDAATNVAQRFPSSRSFRELDFLAVRNDVLGRGGAGSMIATEDDWARWSIQRMADDTTQQVNDDLYATLFRDVVFQQTHRSSTVVDPTPTP